MAELVNNKRLIKANVDMSMPTLAESFRVQEDLTVDGATILTGPLTVTDTSLVVNLNADMVDGHNAGNAPGDIPISNGSLCTNLNADLLDGYTAGNSSGNIPISNGTVNTNLNADTVDGKHVGSSGNTIPLLDQANTVSGVQTFTARPAFNGGTSGSSSPFTVDSTQVVANLNADMLDAAHKSIDDTFASNSDSLIPTEKAVKTYVTAGNILTAYAYTTGGSYTIAIPAYARFMEIALLGGGGGGGGGSHSYDTGGGGGGSGGCSWFLLPRRIFTLKETLSNLTVICGAGGAGGANQSSSGNGSTGGASYISELLSYFRITASGGGGGGTGHTGAGAVGGAAGTGYGTFAGAGIAGGSSSLNNYYSGAGGGSGKGASGVTAGWFEGYSGGTGTASVKSSVGANATRGAGAAGGGGDSNASYYGGRGGDGIAIVRFFR